MKIKHLMLVGILATWSCMFGHDTRAKKIVGLVQVRNEATLVEQCLHALSLYTDAIVVLDDGSDDTTVMCVQHVAEQYHVEKILCNKMSTWLSHGESYNRQQLLDAGRLIGGTHFIVIDADELLTANCATGHFLRNTILRLNSGDRLMMNIMHAWGSLERYRIYFQEKMKYFIFCDNATCFYTPEFLHVLRVPLNLSGGANLILDDDRYGLLHLGYLNWDNVLIRQAWYKCLERVKDPKKSLEVINSWYPCHKEKNEATHQLPAEWLQGYTFFDATLFDTRNSWHAQHVLAWFDEYGRDFFRDLDIWHIDWDKISNMHR